MTQRTKAQLATNQAANLATSSNITAAELRGELTDLTDSLAGQTASARTTWAVAGGSAPTYTAIDPFGSFGGAVQPNLGTSPTQDSSFNRIGSECFASCRIIWGTSPTVGAGFYALTGLPVVPRYTTGQGRNVGYGFMYDQSANESYNVNVVLDPAFHASLPVIFLHYGVDTGNLILPSGVTGSWFFSSANPVVPAAGDILNITLQYEGV